MMKPRTTTAFMAVLILFWSGLVSLSAGEQEKAPNGFERAVILLHEGIFLEAVHELERFVTVYPAHEKGRMLLARTLYRVKREARAAEEASNVLRINPNNVDAQGLLTRIRSEFGQRLNRKDHAEVLRYARMCAVPGSYDRAADFYRLALSLDDEVSVHLEFARMLSWAGRNEESAYQYEHVLEANPGNVDALAEVGRVYNAWAVYASDCSISGRAKNPFWRSGLDVGSDSRTNLVRKGKEGFRALASVDSKTDWRG